MDRAVNWAAVTLPVVDRKLERMRQITARVRRFRPWCDEAGVALVALRAGEGPVWLAQALYS